MKHRIALGAALATMVATAPVAGQDDTEALKLQTANIEARTALAEAKAAAVQQRLDLLGLKTDATGKTELKDKGGEFEGWLLSSRAIDAAAGKLNGRLTQLVPNGALVLLAGDETLDMGLPATMSARLDFLRAQSDAALDDPRCPAPGSPPRPQSMIGPGVLTGVGALIGAFRTDTTISGFTGPDDARLVIAALATARGDDQLRGARWIVPNEMVGVPASSKLIATWNGIQASRTKIAACRMRLAKLGDKAKDDVARFDAQLANIDEFATKQVGAGDGVSPLVRAAQIEAIADVKPMVLRLHVEKAGGSILNRRNLWTALGFPAVGITGGAVIGWRVTDPTSGQLLAGGNYICRTELTSMRAVHRGRMQPSDCDWKASGQ